MESIEVRRKNEVDKWYGEIDDSVKDLLNYIDHLPSMVGAEPFSINDEWLIMNIAKFILEQYGNLKPEEIHLAFTLAAKRRLKDENHKVVDATTYGQKLSINIVGKVLTAYQEGVRRVKSEPERLKSVQMSKRIEASRNTMDPKDAYDLLVKLCEEEGEFPKMFFLYSNVGNYLKSIDAFKDWSDKKKNELRARAEDLVPSTKTGSLTRANPEERKRKVLDMRRELFIKKWFEENVIGVQKA